MSPDELARDVPQFTLVSPAVVRGFRLGFTRYSGQRRGGVADLVPDIDGETEGVLYRVPRAALPGLDVREGAPEHYRRDFIAVRAVDGKMYDRVLTYVVARKRSEDIPPHPDYAQTVLAGAAAHLSPPYVAWVRDLIDGLLERPASTDGRGPGAGPGRASDRGPGRRSGSTQGPVSGHRRRSRRRR